MVLALVYLQLDCGPENVPKADKDAEIFSTYLAYVTHDTGTIERSINEEEMSEREGVADIFFVNFDLAVGTGEKFKGIYMESGAQHSKIYIRQAWQYEDYTNVKLALSPNGKQYKFGDNSAQGLRPVIMRMPLAGSHIVDMAAEVLNVGVPFLLGI